MISPCLYYWVNLNPATGEPLMTTMRAQDNNRYDVGYGPCTEARVPPYQMVAPQGLKQCFPKSGLRYFYKVNNRTGRILPNSMFSQQGKPANMCIGHYNILEFKIFG